MPTQTQIPGTEAPRIKEIDVAADKYVDVRDARIDASKKEVAAKERLIEIVQANADKIAPNDKGQRIYRYGEDLAVVLTPGKPKIKVKHVDDDEEEESED